MKTAKYVEREFLTKESVEWNRAHELCPICKRGMICDTIIPTSGSFQSMPVKVQFKAMRQTCNVCGTEVVTKETLAMNRKLAASAFYETYKGQNLFGESND